MSIGERIAEKIMSQVQPDHGQIPWENERLRIATLINQELSRVAQENAELNEKTRAFEDQHLEDGVIYAELLNHARALHLICRTVDDNKPYTPDHPVYKGLEEHVKRGQKVVAALKALQPNADTARALDYIREQASAWSSTGDNQSLKNAMKHFVKIIDAARGAEQKTYEQLVN